MPVHTRALLVYIATLNSRCTACGALLLKFARFRKARLSARETILHGACFWRLAAAAAPRVHGGFLPGAGMVCCALLRTGGVCACVLVQRRGGDDPVSTGGLN